MYNWWWLSIPFALFYIILVFIGQIWMRKRNKKYELRKALIIWNVFLAVFSFWGACRCVPELLHSLTKHGFQHSLCNPILKKGVTGLCYGLFAPTGRWFTSMNLCVHTVMYSYFALRAARFRVPQFIQQSITVLQLIQMLVGCIVNTAAYKYKQDGYYCMTSNSNIVVSVVLYVIYLILFAHFFYLSYLQKGMNKNMKERTD
ncbi:unnamed protein product [Rotaria sp. Silwood2]|nr:unnamed protein product [Rotaria sp. Silwood2]